MRVRRSWGIGLVLCYALLVVGAGFGLRNPWPPDEPRFALIAREMVETGQWLIPRIAGELYADKPPLFFWVVAALLQVTGSLPVALLVPALLAGLATLLLVYDLARRLWGTPVAAHAAGALALSVQFVVEARSGQIDGFLLGLATLSLCGLLRHLLLGPAWGWWVVGWTAAGLGVISKGVGFLPLLVLVPYLLWSRGRVRGRWWQWLAGPAAMALVVAAWLVPMVVVTTASADASLVAYRDEILWRQTLVRYVEPWGHFRPPWYFLTNVIPIFWLPLVLLLPWLLPRWREAWRARDARVLLPLAWVVLVVAFFSVSPGKRGIYILPALPAFTLAAAPWLVELVRSTAVQRLARLTLAVIGTLLLSTAAWAAWWPVEEVQKVQEAAGLKASLVLLVAAAGFLGAGLLAGKGRAVPAWFSVTLLGWQGFGWVLVPRLDGERSGAAFMSQVRAAVPAGGELGLVGWKEQFILQARMPVTDFGYRRQDKGRELAEALEWAAARPQRLVLVAENHPGFEAPTVARVSFMGKQHRQRWWLVAPGPPGAAAEEERMTGPAPSPAETVMK